MLHWINDHFKEFFIYSTQSYGINCKWFFFLLPFWGWMFEPEIRNLFCVHFNFVVDFFVFVFSIHWFRLFISFQIKAFMCLFQFFILNAITRRIKYIKLWVFHGLFRLFFFCLSLSRFRTCAFAAYFVTSWRKNCFFFSSREICKEKKRATSAYNRIYEFMVRKYFSAIYYSYSILWFLHIWIDISSIKYFFFFVFFFYFF